jgi:hypothetical protein
MLGNWSTSRLEYLLVDRFKDSKGEVSLIYRLDVAIDRD